MEVQVEDTAGFFKTFGGVDWVGREHDCLVIRVGTFKTYYPIENVREWQTTTEIGAFETRR